MTAVRAIFANDLSTFPHIGCELVNGNLKQAIREIATLVGTIPHDQLAQPEALRTLKQGDVIVINGEGNFHARNPRKLGEIHALSIAAKKIGKRVALINTVGQDIPPGLDLSVFDFVSTRESSSERAFREAGYTGELMVAPDGTLLTKHEPTLQRANRVIVTDCVLRRSTRELRDFARSLRKLGHDVKFVSFKKKRFFNKSLPIADMLDLFAGSRLVVAGRFHANCFAFITQTPVASLDSNTHKTRSMMQDFGFEDQHFGNIDQLQAAVLEALDNPLALSKATTADQLERCRQTIMTSLRRALDLA